MVEGKGKTIFAAALEAHANSRAHGWWDGVQLPLRDPQVIAAKLCLIHSEVSEALEEVRQRDPRQSYYEGPPRQGKPCGFGTELADIIIRVFDLAEATGVDIADAIAEKHAYNKTRPHRHGDKAL